jgi:predicted dehydrogenase
MPGSTLGVGIIGVSPVRGWAATAHIPALRALPNYEIRALSAHSAELARAAGDVFGVGAVFSDHEELVTQPDIDLVAVTVKVPHHRELVFAALAAGKAVYCEWPLGRDLDEARAMAALATERGVRTVIGLQARQAPAIELVQGLLRDGYVGEVLSTTMIGLSVPGDVVIQPNVYMLDRTNGANLLTVAVGHSLDTLNHVLGEFADLSAVSAIRRPLITAEQTREQITKTSPDQIAVIGTLTSGATASVHFREAVAGGTWFLWEINGTAGTLRITADAAYPEIFPLTVRRSARGGRAHKASRPGGADTEMARAHQPGRGARLQRRACLRCLRRRHRQRDSHRAGLCRRRPAPRGHRRHRAVCGIWGTGDGIALHRAERESRDDGRSTVPRRGSMTAVLREGFWGVEPTLGFEPRTCCLRTRSA